ncbi:MAG: hypothetical protein KDE27_02855 [Planctomycetes bacterium]|nr:hypothetical protein [Planctomycetota bacterium]
MIQHPHCSDRENERGVALVLAVIFTVIVLGITVSGAMILQSHRTMTKTSFVMHGQAMGFAKSGLIEALGWLRKQTSQPVTAFDPKLDTGVNPPIIETIEPDVGIVREFEITESIWGRYEVWKEWAADPDPVRLAWRQQMECNDLSAVRASLTPGSIWRIRSLGYVFRRTDPNAAFNEAPNQVIGQEMAEVEVRRLALQPPGQAALCARTATQVRILTRGQVLGGSTAAGLYYESGTDPHVVTGASAVLSGSPSYASISPYDDSFDTVFGVSAEELVAMADNNVTNPNDFPSPVPVNTLVVCSADVTFDSTMPLAGTGIVVVLGDVRIDAGSYSNFSGLLYVEGNLWMREPSEIRGAVVVTGSVQVQGGTGDYARISYDDGILNALRQELGTYRLSSTISRPMAQDK